MTSDAEHWGKVAKVTEEEVLAFFKNFCNWTYWLTNTDVIGGGLDILMDFNNLYIGTGELVLIEVKHIESYYISPKNFKTQVEKLKTQIKEFRNKENELKYFGKNEKLVGIINKGILFHLYEDYRHNKFLEMVEKTEIKELSNESPPTIYCINNYYISRILKLVQFLKNDFIYWYYPVFKKNRIPLMSIQPSPNHLVSNLGIIYQSNSYDEYGNIITFDKIGKNSLIFYSFDEPIIRNCEFFLSYFEINKIELNLIGKFIFLKGDHKESENYLQNLLNVGINIEEKNMVILSKINENAIDDLRKVFPDD